MLDNIPNCITETVPSADCLLRREYDNQFNYGYFVKKWKV